eukprot:Selendium_serpulae@DN6476_c0_g1_i1.p1
MSRSGGSPLNALSPVNGLDEEYIVKRIKFFGGWQPTLCQNKNGPCPLLAIANVMLLRGILNLDNSEHRVTSKWLVSAIGRQIERRNQINLGNPDVAENYKRNINETLSFLPSLVYGLNVNCKFTSPTAFEYTPTLNVFDLLNINLFHGWIVSPIDDVVYPVISPLSYNQLMEKVLLYHQLCLDSNVCKREDVDQELLQELEAHKDALTERECSPQWPVWAAEEVNAQELTLSFDGKAKSSGSLTGQTLSPTTPATPARFRRTSAEAPRKMLPEELLSQEIMPQELNEDMPQSPRIKQASMLQTTREESTNASTCTAKSKSDDRMPEEAVNKGPASPSTPTKNHIHDMSLAQMKTVLFEGSVLHKMITETATQLTYEGLVQLHDSLKEKEAGVLFRNNHFSTIFKYEKGLYTLATDVTFCDTPEAVWERLDQIDGDTVYCDGRFRGPEERRRRQTASSATPIDTRMNRNGPLSSSSADCVIPLQSKRPDQEQTRPPSGAVRKKTGRKKKICDMM